MPKKYNNGILNILMSHYVCSDTVKCQIWAAESVDLDTGKIGRYIMLTASVLDDTTFQNSIVFRLCPFKAITFAYGIN